MIGYPVAALALASLTIQVLPLLSRLRIADAAAAPIRLPRLGLALLLALLYFALWIPLGFQLDTVLFLIVAPLMLGQRPRFIGRLIAIAVAIALLFVFLFHLGSGAILPSGFLHLEWP